jgi:pimeloyl-ACP methyl ester carboxylesterase
MGRQAPAGWLGIHTTAARDRCGARRRRARASGTLRQGTRVVRDPENVRDEPEPGLRDDDDRAAAGGRLRPDGLAENRAQNLLSAAAQKTDQITLLVAITVFPEDDLFRAPETWARRAFPSLIYFREAERGGHFAAWEEPELFAAELRAAFRSLR